MKYFGFLARYIVVPLLILRFLLWRDHQQKKQVPESLQSWPEDVVLLGHVITAVTYTTPWDNYLVATKVWWYDPELVTGVTIGWVPIEEYTFFILQSLMTGSWLQYMMRRFPAEEKPYDRNPAGRIAMTGALGLLWLASMRGLFFGSDANRYRHLILGWALPPIMLQTAIGGDIIWRHRKLIASTLVPATLYLGLVDSRAIESGTWKINPEKSTQHEPIKNLPIEELLFFFITNALLTFGITLVQAKESEERLPKFLRDRYNQFKTNRMQK